MGEGAFGFGRHGGLLEGWWISDGTLEARRN
jgi:hypothetical protein